MLSISEFDDYVIDFKNVCGVLELNLIGSVKIRSITLVGNNQEVLAGSVSYILKKRGASILKFSDNGHKKLL